MKNHRRRRTDQTIIRKQAAQRISGEQFLAAFRTTPLGVVLLTAAVYWWFPTMPGSLKAVIPALAYLTALFGLFLTLCFSRGRAFFVLLILFISQLAEFAAFPAHIDKGLAMHEIEALFSLLLPCNLLYFGTATERGILAPAGRRAFLVIGLQLLFIAGVVLSGDRSLIAEMDKPFLASLLPFKTAVPHAALLAAGMCGLILLAGRRQGSQTAHFRLSMFWTLLAVMLARHFQYDFGLMSLFYAAAGFAILVTVIQDYYFKAYLDELTGLPSRRSLNEEMSSLEGDYTIAMLDVDFFKKFNDTYGHDAGDDVLRFIAAIMKEFSYGKAFRYGGEEFTVLLPMPLEDAMPHLEELCCTIAGSSFVLRGAKRGEKKLSVTVSIGAAGPGPKHKLADTVIKAADTALYRAKESGRNCVCK